MLTAQVAFFTNCHMRDHATRIRYAKECCEQELDTQRERFDACASACRACRLGRCAKCLRAFCRRDWDPDSANGWERVWPWAMQLFNQDCSLNSNQEEVISSGEEDKAEWNNENHAIEMSGACIQLQTEIEKRNRSQASTTYPGARPRG